MEPDGTTVAEAAPPPSPTTGRRLVTITRRSAILVFAYLVLSLADPKNVPRPTVLPQPPDHHSGGGCAFTEEWFEDDGLFWTYHRYEDPGLPL